MGVSLVEFEKALHALSEALKLPKNDIVRDAVIQRFEFCVELAWKCARKALGSATTSPKQIVREMAQAGLITEVEFWLKAIDQRNLSVHTYNEVLAEEVYKFVQAFYPQAQDLLQKIKQI